MEKGTWFDKYFYINLLKVSTYGSDTFNPNRMAEPFNPDNNDTDGDSLNDFYETTVSKRILILLIMDGRCISGYGIESIFKGI